MKAVLAFVVVLLLVVLTDASIKFGFEAEIHATHVVALKDNKMYALREKDVIESSNGLIASIDEASQDVCLPESIGDVRYITQEDWDKTLKNIVENKELNDEERQIYRALLTDNYKVAGSSAHNFFALHTNNKYQCTDYTHSVSPGLGLDTYSGIVEFKTDPLNTLTACDAAMNQLKISLGAWKEKCDTADQFLVVDGDIPDRSDTHLEFWKEAPKTKGKWLEMLECTTMFPNKQEEFSFGVVRPQFTFGVNIAKLDKSNQNQRALLSNYFDVDATEVIAAIPGLVTADEKNFVHFLFAYLNIIASYWTGRKVDTRNKNTANPRIHFDWCHMAGCLKKQGKLSHDIGSYVSQVNAKKAVQKELEKIRFFGANPSLLKMFFQVLHDNSAECASLHVNDAIADYYVNPDDGVRKDVDVDDGSCVMIFESPFPPALVTAPLETRVCSANDNFVAALNSLGHHLVKPQVIPQIVPKSSKSAERRRRRKMNKKIQQELEKVMAERTEQELLKKKLEDHQKKKESLVGGDKRTPEQIEQDREKIRRKLHDKLEALRQKRRGY